MRFINAGMKFLIHTLGCIIIRPFILINRPGSHMLEREDLKILYISLAYRGDFVLSLPAIAAIKKRFPDAGLFCWVRGYNKSLAELNPDIDGVMVYDDYRSRGMAVLKEISLKKTHKGFFEHFRQERFDLSIDDSGPAFASLLCAYAKIPFRIGRNSQGFGFLNHYEYPYDYNAHLIKKKFKLLEPLNIFAGGDEALIPRINISADNRETVLKKANLHNIANGYYTVQVSAGWQAKNWSDDKFVQVINEFSSYSGLIPVFIGGAEDNSRIKSIESKLTTKSFNLAGDIDLGETAILISGAEYHLGVDSVGSHLAAATGVKSLTVFGPTNPRLIAVLTDKNIAIYKKAVCTPAEDKIYCCKDAGRSCRDVVCMRELAAKEVLEVLIDHREGKKISRVVAVE
jgi:ADP-heptose:LPS heptosyltransferase